jgi:hypothetical protein
LYDRICFMAQQGWLLKHGSASWGVGTHGFIEFSAVASNSDSCNNLGDIPMHLEGVLPGRFPTPAWSRRFHVRECRYLCKAISAVDSSFVTKGKAKRHCQCLPSLVYRAESTDSSAFPYTYTALTLGLATQKYKL